MNNTFEEELNKAYNYLLKRRRTSIEMKKFLNGFNHEEEIYNYLVKEHFIDDKSYAESYLHDKMLYTSRGSELILKDLRMLDIDEAILEDLDLMLDYEFEKLQKEFEREITNNIKRSIRAMKSYLFEKYLKKGFNKENIETLISNIDFDEEKILKRVQEEEREKLSRKYQGDELNMRIKKSLISKGFRV